MAHKLRICAFGEEWPWGKEEERVVPLNVKRWKQIEMGVGDGGERKTKRKKDGSQAKANVATEEPRKWWGKIVSESESNNGY